jgi:hypothetical protein
MGTPSDRTKASAAGVVVVLMALLSFYNPWVPVVSHVDFGIHELGHLLFGFLPFKGMLLAGSGLQVAAPVLLVGYFWRFRGDLVAAGVMLGWAGVSLRNVAQYIGDAPYLRFSIIGSVHDWNELLWLWDKMDMADNVAGFVGFLGLLAFSGGLALSARVMYTSAQDVSVSSTHS